MARMVTRRTGTVSIAVLMLVGTVGSPVGAGGKSAKCMGHTATIVGTKKADELRGTSGRDVIVARGGNDFVFARGGNDIICMGDGDFDVVWAGGGDDVIKGGRGFDVIFPGGGDDIVNGGKGFDLPTYEGSTKAITADLGTGVVTGQGDDTLIRVEGIVGGEGDDTLIGTDEGEDLQGFGGNDTIVAGGGDDSILAGAGNDEIDGGEGIDFVDNYWAHGGPRIDDDIAAEDGATIDLTAGTTTGGPDVGNDTVVSIEGVSGTQKDDTIVGSDGNDFLFGGEGDDSIDLVEPGEPDEIGVTDVAIPGVGNDSVTGGPGGNDLVTYFFNGFLTEVNKGVNLDLGAGTATGEDVGDDTFTGIESAEGTDFKDVLRGTDGPNTLVGLDGRDLLYGLGGDDILDGDALIFGDTFELGGKDDLHGGDGTDVCLGGSDADTGCESDELPRMTRRAAQFRLWYSRLPAVRGYLR